MRITLCCSVLFLGLFLASPGFGEIYRWTDPAGKVHFTSDLGQVPPRQRAGARARASQPSPGSLQTFSSPTPRGAARLSRHRRSLAPGATLSIPFQKQGTLMVVNVELNDRVSAPFLVDTGASHVSIPESVVRRLGIRIGPDTPRAQISTANGIVAEPVVKIESVRVGDAEVQHLDAFVSSSMDVGLLGGTFFNNFVYQIDAAAQTITLAPNARVRGGFTQDQWRERFQRARLPIQQIDRHLEDGRLFREGRVHELEARRQQLVLVLEALDREANAVLVPQAWRH